MSMDRSWYTRVVVILAVTLGTAWLLVPTYYSFFRLPASERNDLRKLSEALPAWAPPAKYRLALGLDLKGGIYMVLRVDTKSAMNKRTDRRAQQMSSWLKDKKFDDVTITTTPESGLVELTPKDPARIGEMLRELLDTFQDFSLEQDNGKSIILRQRDDVARATMGEAVDQAMLVIRRRIDKWGVAEVDVRKLSNESIQISLPGQQDPEQAKELIGTTAQLEFRLVDENPKAIQTLFDTTPPPAGSGIEIGTNDLDQSSPPKPYLEGTDRDALLAYVQGHIPANQEVILHCVEGGGNNQRCQRYYTFVVDKKVALSGENLTNADASRDTASNRVQVNFQFDSVGAKELDEFTAANVNKRMAIILDENVIMAPTIQERIGGGSGRITLGRATDLAPAQLLALALKAGALPAPVTIGEIRQVGATLGDDLIRRGALAAICGLLLVVAFMAIYYRVSGLIADVALLLNGALILAGLAAFGATLTLPGIAGFVLTLGIAVDANVLINERVREELRNGKSARAAIDQGYDRAFWTIFDAHVTTFIAGLILMKTGTGPVQGFATSLIIGIIASLFTSIVVTRTITTYLVHGRGATKVSV